MQLTDDVIDGISARDAEKLLERLQKRLQRCVIDGQDGAVAVRCEVNKGRFTLLLCPKCIEQHRLPEGRSSDV